MITNINKKVICVKDIPSNIIEEAIFILKTDTSSANKNSEKRKELAQKETEDFLNEYISKLKQDNFKEKRVKQKVLNREKIKVFLITVAVLVSCYLLFTIK